MAFDFDLFVIGAGSGGVRASRISAQYGARVAVAEDLYLGGTCVNVGCVPKKLFVYASEFSQSFHSATGFGWNVGDSSFTWETLRDNKTEEISRLNGIYGTMLDRAGVTTINGFASIVDPHTVKVGDKTYSAERILIATGGWPNKPSFPGAEHTITSNDIFSLKSWPKSVLVHGGGYIAVEFAGIFDGLGCDTELLYRKELFLRGFDKEVREFVAKQMSLRDLRLSFNTDIQSIEKLDDGRLKVTLVSNDGETSERLVDAVFTAIGRKPKTSGLGLDTCGVEVDAKGYIKVNDGFQTNVPSIFALGDVVGRMELTPVALAEGMALAKHWFDGQPLKVGYDNIPTAVFCQPNIGTVGLSEEQAKERGINIQVFASEFRAMKNTLSGSQERTLMKLIVDASNDKVIGAHMVGPDAGEIIQGLAIAIKAGASKADFDETIGIHPTSAEEFVTMREPRS